MRFRTYDCPSLRVNSGRLAERSIAVPTRTTGPAVAVAASMAPAGDEQEPQPRPCGGRAVDEGVAFDVWLQRGLRRAYDAVAA